jgi:hypothetical protein
MKKWYLFSVIFILGLSSFVLAAGSSTANSNNEEATVRGTDGMLMCEDKATLRERIKCRFENPSATYKEAYDTVEEACRDDRYRTKCQALYQRAATCYSQSDYAVKKECFLKESGININTGGTFRASPDESKRNYVILLLYELQERIEGIQEEGKITVDQATSLVTKIVEIKKMILAKEARASIAVKINEFKQEYRTVMSEVKQ